MRAGSIEILAHNGNYMKKDCDTKIVKAFLSLIAAGLFHGSLGAHALPHSGGGII
jgi:hypothetical protein